MSTSSYDKPDFWALKAKKEGYPARSVYKLQEIDEKFHLIKAGMRIIDIGAAPGSWSQWLLKRLAGTGFLSAVDLQPLTMNSPHSNFFFVRGDLYDPAVRSQLIAKGPYNLVASDAAPGTTGNRVVDQGGSEAIVDAVISYAEESLAPGGSFVAKLFQGGAERELIDRLKTRFSTARSFKPKACRSNSFEIYLVASGFKG